MDNNERLNERAGIFFVLMDLHPNKEGEVRGVTCYELLKGHIASYGSEKLYLELEKFSAEIRLAEEQVKKKG